MLQNQLKSPFLKSLLSDMMNRSLLLKKKHRVKLFGPRSPCGNTFNPSEKHPHVDNQERHGSADAVRQQVARRRRHAVNVELELSAARLRLVAGAGKVALFVVELLRDARNVFRAPALSVFFFANKPG